MRNRQQVSRNVASALAGLLVACGGSGAVDPGPALGGGGAGLGGSSASAGSVGIPVAVAGSGAPDAGGGTSAATSGAGGMGSAGKGSAASGSGGLSSAGSSASGGSSTGGFSTGGSAEAGASTAGNSSVLYPERARLLEVLERVNGQFAAKWPDPGKAIDANHPSTIWTRAIYYEGLLNLYSASPQKKYYDYALGWGTSHSWQLRDNNSNTTSADNQCAGQTYQDLYELDGSKDAVRIAAIKQSIDGMVKSSSSNAWTWVDAVQMAMPVFARFGVLTGDAKYFDKMYALYSHTKTIEGGGLYNTKDHLWWRDAVWKPKKTPNAQETYWSRGNGWVFAALARVLDRLPASDPHRAEYEQDFKAMAGALLAIQRADGFWNVSLADPQQYGGPEGSGTSLFLYGFAWGVRKGLLSEATYGASAVRAWNALVSVSVHENGFLGFMQGTGDDPSDGQPLTYDKIPDYEDYGVGCFLLGGSELSKLVK